MAPAESRRLCDPKQIPQQGGSVLENTAVDDPNLKCCLLTIPRKTFKV